MVITSHAHNKIDKAYILSPNFNKYPRPKDGYINFNDITDQDELYTKGAEHLAKVDEPRVTYEVRGIIDNVSLGDTITVEDEQLGIDVKVRIVEREYFPYEKRLPNLVLANSIDTIEDYLARLNDVKRTVENVTSKGRVNAHWLDGIINALTTQIKGSGSYANAEVIDGSGILFENTNPSSPDYGAMYIGPGIFAIASEKTSAGEWDWRSFGSGQGFTADAINTGQLLTSLIKIVSSEGNPVLEIIDDTIYIRDKSNNIRCVIGQYAQNKFGIKITNGEIYSTMVQTGEEGATTFVRMTPQGQLEVYSEGKKRISINARSLQPSISFYDSNGEITMDIQEVDGGKVGIIPRFGLSTISSIFFGNEINNRLEVGRNGRIGLHLQRYNDDFGEYTKIEISNDGNINIIAARGRPINISGNEVNINTPAGVGDIRLNGYVTVSRDVTAQDFIYKT